MKVQHNRIREIQQKQCPEGNLELWIPAVKNRKMPNKYLNFQLKEQGKGEQMKSKAGSRKKVKSGNNKIDNRKTIERINIAKISSLKRSTKLTNL